ncbi:hypothetical protein ABKV19_026813 [Rosa sericea]
MKVKVISRSTDEHTKERSQDLQRVFHNYDPAIRTQEKAVEYVRALNAAKLDKIFAKPFVGAMDGHIDAISCMAKNMNHLVGIFSGSMDGDIRLWDIASRERAKNQNWKKKENKDKEEEGEERVNTTQNPSSSSSSSLHTCLHTNPLSISCPPCSNSNPSYFVLLLLLLLLL